MDAYSRRDFLPPSFLPCVPTPPTMSPCFPSHPDVDMLLPPISRSPSQETSNPGAPSHPAAPPSVHSDKAVKSSSSSRRWNNCYSQLLIRVFYQLKMEDKSAALEVKQQVEEDWKHQLHLIHKRQKTEIHPRND